MSHVRQQIRDAAVAALTGLTTTGARVYASRLRPLADDELPCLLVNTDAEQVTVTDVGGAVLMRTLDLSIRCMAKATADLDDTLDTLLAEVEVALYEETLGGTVKSLELVSVEIEMDDSTDKPVGVLTARYQAIYFSHAGTPGTAL